MATHTVNDLQVELLQSIFEFLSSTADLFRVQRVCRKWYVVTNKPTMTGRHGDDEDDDEDDGDGEDEQWSKYRNLSCSGETLWRQHVMNKVKAIIFVQHGRRSGSMLMVKQWKDMAQKLDVELGVMEERRLWWKNNREQILANQSRAALPGEQPPDVVFEEENSMILKAVRASTFDSTRQNVEQTRMYFDTVLRFGSFWSSTGSEDPSENEYLMYMLKEPNITEECITQKYKPSRRLGSFFMVLDELRVKPFLANWQNDNIYPSRRVSLSIGLTHDCHERMGFDEELYTTEEFDVDVNLHEFQRFHIGPILIIGELSEEDEIPTLVSPGCGSSTSNAPDTMGKKVLLHVNKHLFAEDTTHNTGKIYEFNNKENNESDDEDGNDNDGDNDEVVEEGEEGVEDQNGDDGEQTVLVDRDIMMEALERSGGEINVDMLRFIRMRMDQQSQLREQNRFRNSLATPFLTRVNLLGKVQRQPGDELYYNCVELLDITGRMQFL